MQIHCSTCSVILNATATQYTGSLNMSTAPTNKYSEVVVIHACAFQSSLLGCQMTSMSQKPFSLYEQWLDFFQAHLTYGTAAEEQMSTRARVEKAGNGRRSPGLEDCERHCPHPRPPRYPGALAHLQDPHRHAHSPFQPPHKGASSINRVSPMSLAPLRRATLDWQAHLQAPGAPARLQPACQNHLAHSLPGGHSCFFKAEKEHYFVLSHISKHRKSNKVNREKTISNEVRRKITQGNGGKSFL